MMINRSNYESYFIDYIDGKLPDELVNDFLDFLEKNPDLAEELKAVADLKLQPENYSFPNKDALLKEDELTIDSDDFRAVAFLEDDLDEEEKERFVAELAGNDELLKTMQLLGKTKLQADSSVVFPDKSKLMRKNRRVVYLRMLQAAAVLILFFSVWALVPWSKKPTADPFLAEQKTSAKTEQPIVAKTPETKKESEPGYSAQTQSEPVKTDEQPKQEQIIKLQTKTQADEAASPEPVLLTQREEIPAQIQPISEPIAAVGFEPKKVKMELEEAVPAPEERTLSVEQYLAHKLISAPKGESFTLSNVANAGLKAAESISSDRLDVERTKDGRVEQIKFESRLIAFSIPFRKNR